MAAVGEREAAMKQGMVIQVHLLHPRAARPVPNPALKCAAQPAQGLPCDAAGALQPCNHTHALNLHHSAGPGVRAGHTL